MSKKIKLVMSGSGTKFPVFIGAIRRLEEAGCEIEAVAGTSGGAIVAAGIASGKTHSDDMEALVREVLPQMPKLVKPSILSLVWNFGFFKTRKLRKVLDQHLVSRMGNVRVPCKIVTANVDARGDERSAVVWSNSETPDQNLAEVTAASMAIPFVFEQVLIDGEDHVDGGLLKNFAVDAFGNASNVVGLTFSGRLGKYEEAPWWRPVSRLVNRFLRLLDLVMVQNVREDIEDASKATTILLKTSIGGLDFDIDNQKIDTMIQDGWESVDKFLEENPSALL